MAKTSGPLLSENAHGTVAETLTYSKRSSGNQVRYQKKQKDANTPAQIIQRGYFLTASGWWGEMTKSEQNDFDGYDERAA
jgi:hypothetical protein